MHGLSLNDYISGADRKQLLRAAGAMVIPVKSRLVVFSRTLTDVTTKGTHCNALEKFVPLMVSDNFSDVVHLRINLNLVCSPAPA